MWANMTLSSSINFQQEYQVAARRGIVWRVLRWVVLAAIVFVLLPYLITPLYAVINPVSVPMLGRWLTGERVDRVWMPLERMSPNVPLAVLGAEDGKFCTHRGIDFGELKAAILEADEAGEARGASTITQQTVKNLFFWQGRSFVRKVLEFPLALWLDLVLTKHRQLEIYLNIAEWGPTGEFGIEAGARRAFNRGAANLDANQAALLASMLPNPHRRDAKSPGPGLRRIAGIHLRRISTMKGLDNCVARP
jgi:monofunctional glycosyltransferase